MERYYGYRKVCCKISSFAADRRSGMTGDLQDRCVGPPRLHDGPPKRDDFLRRGTFGAQIA
jgi:hypothetical protein